VRQQLAAFDAAADRVVERIRSPQLDAILFRVSSAADHSLIWHACGLVEGLRRGGDVRWTARFAAAMGFESALTNGVLKSVFGRVRPVDYAELDFRSGLRRPITSAFPSGHATAAFCAATLLGGGPTWYAAAATVSASRVYVRLHHASDVVGGAVIGLALGAALRPLVR
jgi:undecaprenyl-diphosphatase